MNFNIKQQKRPNNSLYLTSRPASVAARHTVARRWETLPNNGLQPTPTHAPFGKGAWRGHRLGRLAFFGRG